MKNNQSFLPINSNKLLNPVVESLFFSNKLKKINFLTNRNFSSSSNSNSGSNKKLDSKPNNILYLFVQFISFMICFLLIIAIHILFFTYLY